MTTKNAFLALILAFSITQCDERSENKSVQDRSVFNASVGGGISSTIAEQWVERKRNTSGREHKFSVSASHLREVLERTDDKLGVFVHHAEDANGLPHLFIAPVKDDLKSWVNGTVLDGAINGFVDEAVAMEQARTFKDEYPDGPWSHFFGIDLFNEITSIEGLTTIDFLVGEDETGQSRLLIYALSESITANGRKLQEAEVFDRGAICPPTCFDE